MDECDYDFNKVGKNMKVANNEDLEIKTKQNDNHGNNNSCKDIKIKQEIKSEKCNNVECSDMKKTNNKNDNDGNYCNDIKMKQEIKSENCKDTDCSDDNMQTTDNNNIEIKNETFSCSNNNETYSCSNNNKNRKYYNEYNMSDCSDDDKNNIADDDGDDDDDNNVYKRHSINIVGYDFMLSDGSKFDIYDTIRKTDFNFPTKKKKSDDSGVENVDYEIVLTDTQSSNNTNMEFSKCRCDARNGSGKKSIQKICENRDQKYHTCTFNAHGNKDTDHESLLPPPSLLSVKDNSSIKRKYKQTNLKETIEVASSSSSSSASSSSSSSSTLTKNSNGNLKKFKLAHECFSSWKLLTGVQKYIIKNVEYKINQDRLNDKYVTVVNCEGIGGCGKTRIISYLCNHKDENTLAMYITKQNKRIQDFINLDYNSGELYEPVVKPTDLSMVRSTEIESVISSSGCGVYTLTLEKLLFATDRKPGLFKRDVVPSDLNINLDLNLNEFIKRFVKNDRYSGKNILLLLDEYTMASPPMIHALIYSMAHIARAPIILMLCGDKYQCGPIGWNKTITYDLQKYHYSCDVIQEIKNNLQLHCTVYEITSVQRCKDDLELARLVYILRTACLKKMKYKQLQYFIINFCYRKNIPIYLQTDNKSALGKVIFNSTYDDDNLDSLVNSDNHTIDNLGDYQSDEEYDYTRSILKDIDFDSKPQVDMLPFVNTFTELYTKLFFCHQSMLEIFNKQINVTEADDSEVIQNANAYKRVLLDDIEKRCISFVYDNFKSYATNTFPLFICKTNNMCNLLSTIFMMILYTNTVVRVKKNLLKSFPADVIESWLMNMSASLPIDNKEYYKRQTLIVGMTYKVTETIKNAEQTHAIINGEQVLLTFIKFNEYSNNIEYIVLNKLQAIDDVDFYIYAGDTKNRLNKGTKQAQYIFPIVPYVCENIYQMQGITLKNTSNCIVNILNCNLNDIYVAISRFQNSNSIKSITMKDYCSSGGSKYSSSSTSKTYFGAEYDSDH